MIKFGPSGSSDRFFQEGLARVEQVPAWLKRNGLDCFEYSFGRGVSITEKKADLIKEAFTKEGVEISVHAPYYVNLASTETDKANNSYNYILTSALRVRQMGGNRVVFHPASVGKEDRQTVFKRTLDRFKVLAEYIYKTGLNDIYFCPETMGKLNQIGTIEEIAKFCKLEKFFIPTIDFGHINAREQGSLKEKKDYVQRLEYLIDELGYEKMKNFHVHFSKIQYTIKGELRHLTFADNIFGPEFDPLAQALVDLKLEPIVICESSGTQADDAIYMKCKYNQVLNNRK